MLNFTYPGYPEIELIDNGADMPVTLGNLDQYIQLLSKTILVDSVLQQVIQFRYGFNQVNFMKIDF
jgi:E3 ubiquitin-protein ligase TRIP12